ncbi:MAG: DUF3320 domain-containing protein [Dehalococcoidia bacterium]
MSGNGGQGKRSIPDVLKEWQERLLQLDRRNNLLYFKPGRRAIPIVDADPDTFAERLLSPRRPQFDFVEPISKRSAMLNLEEPQEAGSTDRVVPGDIHTNLDATDLQRRLRLLQRTDREWEEEQGLNVLFLAMGILEWVDEEGEAARSPLILIPCNLIQPSLRDPFELERESDDAESNATLLYVAQAKHGVTLPEYSDMAPSEYLRLIRSAISKRHDWRVTDDMYLSTFAYSKMPMVKDLERMRNEGVSHPLIRQLAGGGDPDAQDPSLQFPSQRELSGGRLDDLLDLKQQQAILPADATQLMAIEQARSGADLIIHGPPGTGKSQTIANTIATALADGKRVLFVSEKTAALDVVKRRLVERGLGIFCLDMHSERGKKASVYEQLRESLMDARETLTTPPNSLTALLSRRERLNSLVRALHERRSPLNKSVYQLQGEFAELQDIPDVQFVIPSDVADEEAAAEVLAVSEKIARRPREFEDHTTSRWIPLKDTVPSLGLSDLIRHDMDTLLDAVSALGAEMERSSSWLGLEFALSAKEGERMIGILDQLSQAHSVPSEWLRRASLAKLQALAESQSRTQEEYEQLSQTLATMFGESWREVDFRTTAPQAQLSKEQISVLDEAYRSAWRKAVFFPKQDLVEVATAVATSAGDLQRCLRLLTNALVDEPIESMGQITAAIAGAREVSALAPVPPEWLEPVGTARARAALNAARDLLDALAVSERTLFEKCSEGILSVVDEDMQGRYRVEYQGLMGRLRFNFRRDQRSLRTQLRTPGNLSVDEAIEVIELALRVRDLRTEWEDHAARLQSAFGHRFAGRATDWTSIDEDIRRAAEVMRTWRLPGRASQDLLTDADAPNWLPPAIDVCERQRESLSQNLNSLGRKGSLPDDLALSTLQNLATKSLGPLSTIQQVLTATRRSGVKLPAEFDELSSSLAAGLHVLEIEERTAGLADEFSSFGPSYEGLATDWNNVKADLNWIGDLLNRFGANVPEAFYRHVAPSRDLTEYTTLAARLRERTQDVATQIDSLGERFDLHLTWWSNWLESDLGHIATWARDLQENAETSSAWLTYRATIEELNRILQTDVASQIRQVTDQSALVPKVVQRRVIGSWLDTIYANEPALSTFSSREFDHVRSEFTKLDQSLPNAAAQRVRDVCFAQYPSREIAGLRGGEYATLQRQLSRKRGQLSVRRLVESIPHLVQALKPVFLMSPLAVSKFLSRDSSALESISFDVVVFDEASQVFPEDAVPAIDRGNQTIVVGDENQLPPTNFFRRARAGDTDDYAEDEEDGDYFKGVPSILAAAKGAQVGEAYLGVHYRSRHESLIRFSNHWIYKDRPMLVFPSPAVQESGLGIVDTYLPDARYDPSSRTNKGEAERTVDVLFHLLRTCPLDESVGIVALSRTQSDCIQQMIDNRRLLESDVEERFASGREPVFVKNLETVQGDERDHIILSIGYGPTVGSGATPNRFGPINAEGGRRRLNVAITRARKSMTVVHSLHPTAIDAESDGARLLRRFLEYVADPVRSIEAEVTLDPAAEVESPFEAAVEAALIRRGYRVSRQIGVSGYRIDLGILSEDGTRYDLGIECDGATYHSAPAARDRDWLRQSVLEGLGWRIHRVWSTSWIRNLEAELEDIDKAITRARAAARISKVPPAQPPRTEQAVDDADQKGDSPNGGERSPTVEPIKPVDTPEPPELFRPYVEAELDAIAVGAEVQYEVTPVLTRLIRRVVEQEGPVHVDVVVARLRDRYGLGRAGHIVRNRVEEAISDAVSRDHVAWIPTESGDAERSFLAITGADIEPRRPSASSMPRAVEHISLPELQAGVKVVLPAMFSGSREAVIVEVARQFGYQRTGSDIWSRIDAAISQILARHEIVEADSILSPVADRSPSSAQESHPAEQVDIPTIPATREESPKPDSPPAHQEPYAAKLLRAARRSTPQVRARGAAPAASETSTRQAIEYARQHGLEVIDRRPVGGTLWVIGGSDHKAALAPLGFSFTPKGGKVSGHKPSWYFAKKS